MKKRLTWVACVYFVIPITAAIAQHGPHVHGTGELRVAIEAKTLMIEFHSPLDNVLGFEHAPRNDAQRVALTSMTAKLNNALALFALPKDASCVVSAVQIDTPLAETPKYMKSAVRHLEYDDNEHADLTAKYEFLCATSEALGTIEVNLFDAFPGTKLLTAQVIGARGQSEVTLSPSHRIIKF